MSDEIPTLPPATMPEALTIAICTFRRPQLASTLCSLAALQLPDGCLIDIVVADNDHEPSAADLVRQAQATLLVPVRHVHAPAANISVARNACLEHASGRYLAFIDDDELATPTWLVALVRTSRETGADVVLGPVRAVYGPAAPAWMKQGDFHSTFPVHVQGKIHTGYTCNALLDLSKAPLHGLRFDPARGQSGGEDTAFFHEVTAQGGRIEFSPDAEVSEEVPESRATMEWLSRRRFRMGRTHGQIVAQGRGLTFRSLQVGLAASKFAACLILVACHVAHPVKRQRNRLRATLHAGAVGGILGAGAEALYGDSTPRPEQTHAA